MTSFHSPARFPRGFRCASRNVGLKPEAKDLTIFVSEVEANAAAVFTRNHFPGAPIILGREVIRGGRLQAIIANSKVSNVATGARGVENARRMAAAAALELGTSADRVLVSSTGVIGVQLPVERIETGIRGMAGDLQSDPFVGAEGIMTTDTQPKAASRTVTIPVSTNISIPQPNAVGTVTSGGTTVHTVTAANLGPNAANGAVLVDPVVSGLSCSAVTCSATGGAACPASPNMAGLQGVGLTIPTFPATSQLVFVVTCANTATGS